MVEINRICHIGNEPVVVPQSKEGLVVAFGPTDARKVYLPHNDNLIIWLNVGNCILKRVLIVPTTDISILYKGAFLKMGFHPSTLNLPMSYLKSFDKNRVDTLGVFRLSIKLGSDDDGYL